MIKSKKEQEKELALAKQHFLPLQICKLECTLSTKIAAAKMVTPIIYINVFGWKKIASST